MILWHPAAIRPRARELRLSPFPFDPAPFTLWTLHLNGVTASCEVRFVPLGSEVRMLRNGSLLLSQTFPTGDHALAWAAEERKRLQVKWWQARAPSVT